MVAGPPRELSTCSLKQTTRLALTTLCKSSPVDYLIVRYHLDVLSRMIPALQDPKDQRRSEIATWQQRFFF